MGSTIKVIQALEKYFRVVSLRYGFAKPKFSLAWVALPLLYIRNGYYYPCYIKMSFLYLKPSSHYNTT